MDARALAIATLYSLVFYFLEACIDWYTRSFSFRLLESPNQDVHYAMLSLIDNIRISARSAVRKLTLQQPIDADELRTVQGTTLFHLEQTQWKEIGLRGQERRFTAPHTWLSQFIWDIQRSAAERRNMDQQRLTLLKDMFASFTRHLRVVDGPGDAAVVLSLKMKSSLPALTDLGMILFHHFPALPFPSR